MLKIICDACKKEFYNYPSNHRKFCSNKCKNDTQGARSNGKNAPRYRHGMSRTSFHNKWWAMIARCTYKSCQRYPAYGGRGIKVCNDWLIFENFFNDMYKTYIDHCNFYGENQTTLERKNVGGNYSIENCSWATWKEQSSNKQKSIQITYKGKTQSLKQWAAELGIKYHTCYMRLKKYRWSVEKTFEV